MGRFVNRPYLNYSLFNIHLFPCIIPVASSGNTVSHIHRSKKPPLPKGGKGGFRKFSLCAPLAG